MAKIALVSADESHLQHLAGLITQAEPCRATHARHAVSGTDSA